ncbi:MAG: MBL fold metallo-hydrolase [Clostridia bacterium]|nr:MBL fold metallo-hydrolase [Clostridia bacterium]
MLKDKYFLPVPTKTCEEIFSGFGAGIKSHYERRAEVRHEPFRIFGNLYYIGDDKVCRHLIDTGDGLIMFDVGYGYNVPEIEADIRKLGFSPEDIKILIISHGHFDHFCGGNELRRKYGMKVLLSRTDTELIRERPERALMEYAYDPEEGVCWPDETISDGDEITLGNTTIKCVAAPGHTMGTTAFFFDATDGKTVKKVGYFGGVGFLTVYPEYNRRMGLPENKSALLRHTAEKLMKIPVDIMIGNHPGNNRTMEKLDYMKKHPGENPFIDKETWPLFLGELIKNTRMFEKKGF